jgi:hypothetical protein
MPWPARSRIMRRAIAWAARQSSRVQSVVSGLEMVEIDGKTKGAFDMSLCLMLGVSPGREFPAPVRGTSEDYSKHSFPQRAEGVDGILQQLLARHRSWLVAIFFMRRESRSFHSVFFRILGCWQEEDQHGLREVEAAVDRDRDAVAVRSGGRR